MSITLVDGSGSMEGEASIFLAWFCNSSSNDDDDTDMEEFVEEVIHWLRMAYERLSNSMKLAWVAYGARPKNVSTSIHSQNHINSNKPIQSLAEEDMSVNTGLKERHTSWVQEVNREKQNWSKPEKVPEKL